MKTTQTLIATTKEIPKEAVLISHKYMIKAGLIKKISSGIYSWMPLGLKVIEKIKNIVREEMNKHGAIELLLPNIIPYQLLQKTNRHNKFGLELLKIQDRNKKIFYYAPTHEEPIVDVIKNTIKSYKQLPLNLYQIQTKFRDEIRPRFGILRSREFIMKDAYSFHENNKCLEKTYNVIYHAYCNILNKLGLIYKTVKGNNGNIGGNQSHEFQVLTNNGEDTICYSDNSNYAANIELATYIKPNLNKKINSKNQISLIKVQQNITNTNNIYSSINFNIKQIIKTTIIKDAKNNFFALAIRGDHELNKDKVNKLKQITPPYKLATKKEIYSLFNTNSNLIGIYKCNINIIADYSAVMVKDLICGGNKDNYFFINVNWDRDISNYQVADIRNVISGDLSPDGKGILKLHKSIEVAHIFKLNDIYSKAMNVNIANKNGKLKPILMGCYGFGISRTIAAVIEQSHDNDGIIWPETISPYRVIILPINYNNSNKVKKITNKIYKDLITKNIDVILDNRNIRTGTMFSDADLIGYSHHIIISEILLNQGLIEYRNRKSKKKKLITFEKLLNILL